MGHGRESRDVFDLIARQVAHAERDRDAKRGALAQLARRLHLTAVQPHQLVHQSQPLDIISFRVSRACMCRVRRVCRMCCAQACGSVD